MGLKDFHALEEFKDGFLGVYRDLVDDTLPGWAGDVHSVGGGARTQRAIRMATSARHHNLRRLRSYGP